MMFRAALVCAGIALAPLAFGGPRIAVIQSDELSPYTLPVEAFVNEFDEAVTVINIKGRYPNGQAAAKRLMEDPPDIFFCLGAKAAYVMRDFFPKVPMVFASVLTPARYGITGRRVAGISTTVSPAATVSQFASFFEKTKKIGILRGPSISDGRIEEMRKAAAKSGIELVVERARSPKNTMKIFHSMSNQVDAIWLQSDREIITPKVFRRLADACRTRQIPMIVESESMVRAGALFAVTPKPDGLGQQAAEMVKDILNGTSPADLGLQTAEQANVVLNMRTVRTAKLPFDPFLLDFVDITID